MRWKSTLLLIAAAAWFCAGASGQSNIDGQLKKLLQRYPAADTNGDGTLSIAEAQAYRGKIKKTPKKYTIKPDHADIAYGPHAPNRLDLWLTKNNNDKPVPLAIYIHGGGFSGGQKESLNMATAQQLLDAGISVAAVEYRTTNYGPFPIPMHDGARALQYLRYHAAKYNLDKTRVAAFGGSAGGCMSMWLAFHDDLADPDNTDPVLRESTRLTCIAPNGGQSCLDPETLAQWFQCGNLQEHSGGRPLFGITEKEELALPAVQALIKEASPLTHLSKDDPPLFMTYGRPNAPVDETTKPNVWVHHPIFGIELEAIMKPMNMEIYVKYPGGPEITAYENAVDFMIQKLKG